jgi:hypothetical protein
MPLCPKVWSQEHRRFIRARAACLAATLVFAMALAPAASLAEDQTYSMAKTHESSGESSLVEADSNHPAFPLPRDPDLRAAAERGDADLAMYEMSYC